MASAYVPEREGRVACALCVLLSLALAGATGLAQGTANPAPNANPPKSAAHPAAAHAKKRHPAVKPESQPDTAATLVPPAPPAPDWPVNDKAVPASVDWNGRVLRISAENSSLQQILSDVSTATGVKVDGAPTDQRVYGSYGPASAREVLSQLLDGSGYNVLMVGDQGQGTPRSLVLTAKSTTPVANANVPSRQAPDEEVEEPEQIENIDPAAHRPPGLPPGMNRTPQQVQQIQQEIEQRRLQMQQQQQGAPITPPQAPGQPND